MKLSTHYRRCYGCSIFFCEKDVVAFPISLSSFFSVSFRYMVQMYQKKKQKTQGSNWFAYLIEGAAGASFEVYFRSAINMAKVTRTRGRLHGHLLLLN